MKNLFEKMLAHPFATILVVGATGKAISEIIKALQGTSDESPNKTNE